MRFKQVGNKADLAMIVVKNNSTTVTIPAGAPVFFAFNGTDDGLAVTNANSAGTNGQLNCFAGVTPNVMNPSGSALTNFGEAQVYGFCQTVRVVRQIRATSTDSFSSASAVSVGDILTIRTDSGYDAFSDVYASNFTQTISQTVTAAGSFTIPNIEAYCIAAQSDASRSASASSVFGSTSSGSLAVITTLKAFILSL